MSEGIRFGNGMPLPDHFETVAYDVVDYAGRQDGVWMDVGSGSGGLGLALAASHKGVVILLDPDKRALGDALDRAAEHRLLDRIIPLIGTAERMPLLDGTVDVVVSRGSFFFWKDRAAGLREIHRLLRPGGKAMIGGGLGSRYPQWARQEFIRRRRHSQQRLSPKERVKFDQDRHPDTFRQLARQAGLSRFEVIGEGGLAEDDPRAAMGLWLRFEREKSVGI